MTSWLQSPSTVISEPKRGICHYFLLFPFYLPWSDGTWCHDLGFFLILSFKPVFSLSFFTLIKRLFSSSLLSAIRVLSAYLTLLMFPILIPACNSSNPASLMMCSVYWLNKHGDSRQPCRNPFSILNQSVVPHRVLTAASWPAYRFLRRQVQSSGIFISVKASHSLLQST